MSARDKIVGMMAGADPDAGRLRDIAERVADEILAEHAHELADKQRAHTIDNRGLANWQRHILYGLAGETFEAQAALDAFEAALVEELAKLIDPNIP